jgi:tetratricopeptide (TPR) repeat protein
MTGEGLVAPGADWGPEAIAAVTQRVESGVDRRYRALGLRNLSKTLGWAGKLDEADALALAAVELDPEDAEAQYQAGNALYRRGELEGALSCFERSRALSADQAQVYYGLGLVHADLGRPAEAAVFYREAIRRDADFADAHYNLANLLSGQGDLAGAERHYEAALRINPRDVYSMNNLGIVLVRRDRLDEAQAWFERAVATRSDFVDALNNLARLREQRAGRQDRPSSPDK